MRFTADCPLLDPEIVATGARVFRAVPGLDYLNTSIARTLPRGMDVEVIRAAALRALDPLATGHHRAHVTSYAYTHPDRFRVLGLTLPPDRSHLRLTLDTEDDWRLISAVVDHFGDTTVSLAKLVEWLDDNPRLARINAGVTQKRLDEA
jgi:spore coat polysaccharide biosynthesis protein SpsF